MKIFLPLLHVVLVLALQLIKLSCGIKNVNRQQLRAIESYIDRSEDPCVDFYQYSCGNWDQVQLLDEYFDTIGQLDFNANREYKRILKRTRHNITYLKLKFVRNVIDYYNSCVELKDYNPQRYLDWLEIHEMVKWPTMWYKDNANNSSNDNCDWLRMLATINKYSPNGILIETTIMQDRNYTRHSLIDIDKPVINGGFQQLSIQNFIELISVMKHKNWVLIFDQLQSFEDQLETLNSIEDDLGVQQIKYTDLDMTWLKRYVKLSTDLNIDAEINFTVQNLPYMKALFKLLQKQDSKFVCRYLMIRFLWHMHVSGPRFFDKKNCVLHVRSMLPQAMQWLYEQHNKHLLRETPKIKTLFNTIKRQFKHTLDENSNRFGMPILHFLHEKVNNMKIKVGNLPRIGTVTQLEEFYKPLNLSANNFFFNYLRTMTFMYESRLARVYSLLPDNINNFFYLEDEETGASSSPYYLQRSNLVVVPLTLLNMPIYHSQFHDIFKYSSLGFLLAHEITHGFDDSGIEFDLFGNMRGPSNIIKASLYFKENLNCLRAKNPYIIDEKIADVSGLRWAFESYFQNATHSSHVSKHNPKRLFFLNFAQFFCGNTNMAQDRFRDHGPDHMRVFDTLSNFDEFALAYNCTPGSPMHPNRKCQLWR